MKLEEYCKFVKITSELTYRNTQSLTFQSYIEDRLNDIEYSQFLSISSKAAKPNYYIRLKNPECKDSKERGLKMCLFNDNLFEEKSVSPGTTVIKFVPLLKVIGFTNDNCSQCGKHLIDIGDINTKEELEKVHHNSNGFVQAKEFVKNEGIVRCENCKFRVFCSHECKIKAMLDWHDIECDFIDHIQRELITTTNDVNFDTETDQAIEKIILIIITTFRLLVSLVRGDKKVLEIVVNMSDHLKLYEKYVLTGEVDSLEHEAIFKETQNTFGPLITSFFNSKKEQIEHASDIAVDLEPINKGGICRALFLVFVNVSSVMDNFNNNLGLMFDPIFSMINHSCDPNCTLIWKGNGEILVKSVKELKASDELFLNYIPIQMPRELRKQMLKNSFFFDCECLKCSVTDKNFDSMLPINCLFCSQNNRGFVLENFEKYDSLPDIEKRKICSNCENMINVDEIFHNYLEIFRFFRGLNKEAGKLQDLCNWTLESENILHMDSHTFRTGVKLVQKSYEIVPLKSWPMTMLLNIIKVGFQSREPYDIKVLRMTYLTNFLTENMLESKYRLRLGIGSSLYDLSVVSADYLFDQYLRFREEIEEEIIDVVGKGTFSLCMLAYKHLQERFGDGQLNEHQMERSQKDMIQLALEIRRLLEHFERTRNGSRNRDSGLKGKRAGSNASRKSPLEKKTSSYFDAFTQEKFEESLINYEVYMECGAAVQFKAIVPILVAEDYTSFSLKAAVKTSVKTSVKKPVKSEQRLIAEAAETPRPFVARPLWVAQLWS